MAAGQSDSAGASIGQTLNMLQRQAGSGANALAIR